MNHMTVYFLNEYHPLVALKSIGKVSRKVRISEGDLFSLFASRQNQPENEAARFVLPPISTYCQTEALLDSFQKCRRISCDPDSHFHEIQI